MKCSDFKGIDAYNHLRGEELEVVSKQLCGAYEKIERKSKGNRLYTIGERDNRRWKYLNKNSKKLERLKSLNPENMPFLHLTFNGIEEKNTKKATLLRNVLAILHDQNFTEEEKKALIEKI